MVRSDPAEAHWRIGLIERRNSVLRDILERIIDAESIYDLEDFDQAPEAAIFALNSMTYSHGRPPYMAVFGQIPRIGTGHQPGMSPRTPRRCSTRDPQGRSNEGTG